MQRLIFCCLLIALLPACKKDVSGLPDATQTGANTFGCTVNGKFWVPQGFGPFPADNLLEARKLGQNIMINARNFASSPNETEFEIYIENILNPGTYPLNVNTRQGGFAGSYGYYVKRNITPINEWITSSTHTGAVIVSRYDTTAHIISGTFYFNALNIDNSPEPIVVADGRFDLKY